MPKVIGGFDYSKLRTIYSPDSMTNLMRQGIYHDRFEWLASEDRWLARSIAFSRWFGRYISFWAGDRFKEIDEMDLPPYEETGVDYAPIAIRLDNSKDGVTIDELYLGLNIHPSTNWFIKYIAWIADPSTWPSTSPGKFIAVIGGTEIPGEGGYNIVELYFAKSDAQTGFTGKTVLLLRYLGLDGVIYENILDISTSIKYNDWNDFYLHTWYPYTRLVVRNSNGSSIYTLYPSRPVFYRPESIPFVANESSIVANGLVKLRWWSAARLDNIIQLSDTYTTTDTLELAGVYPMHFADRASLIITNTGTNDADIQVRVTNTFGGQEYTEYTATIAAGQNDRINIPGKHTLVKVYAKSTVTGAQTTLQIDYTAK